MYYKFWNTVYDTKSNQINNEEESQQNQTQKLKKKVRSAKIDNEVNK